MDDKVQGLSISEVSAQTGLSVHVLRKYEKEGLLLSDVRRNLNGQRIYDSVDVDWLLNCAKFRACGMLISEIRQYVRLVKEGVGNERERLMILLRQEVRLREEVQNLNSALRLLEYKISLYREHLQRGDGSPPWNESPRNSN